jgi:hypothetical protein
MVSVNQKVWNIISKELCVQKELMHGLINVRALAKYLVDKYSLNVSIDSVISAIRRYESSGFCDLSDDTVINLFKDCIITTRSNVACLTIKRNGINPLSKFHENEIKDMYVISGTGDTKIICDLKDFDSIKSYFKSDELKCETGLSVIGIMLSPEAIKTRGVLAKIASEVSIYGVNIAEMIVCPPEFLIMVKDEDMLPTHEAIMNIKLGKI